MRPCSLSFTLNYLQRVMQEEIGKVDKRKDFLNLYMQPEDQMEESEFEDKIEISTIVDQFCNDLKINLNEHHIPLHLRKEYKVSVDSIIQALDQPLDIFLNNNEAPIFQKALEFISRSQSANAKDASIEVMKSFKKAIYNTLHDIFNALLF